LKLNGFFGTSHGKNACDGGIVEQLVPHDFTKEYSPSRFLFEPRLNFLNAISTAFHLPLLV